MRRSRRRAAAGGGGGLGSVANDVGAGDRRGRHECLWNCKKISSQLTYKSEFKAVLSHIAVVLSSTVVVRALDLAQ
jgi:hypothetical protein